MRDSTASPQFEPGSFRDPDTRIFRHDGAIFRCLTARALDDWTRLASTSFFDRFTREGALVKTEQVTDPKTLPDLDQRWAAVLKHETVPFISYPYEWSFGMLKDAALLQLDLTLAALDEDMTLKDATPFNVQWVGSRPIFIDVGSFTVYEAGEPWAGYRQFCNQFLYPLFLQAYKNVPYHPWLRGSLEGIEAAHLSSLLSLRDYTRPGVMAHVVLQAKAQSRYEDADRDVKKDLHAAGFGVGLIKNNIQRLRRVVERLEWQPFRSTWSEYTKEHSYGDSDLQRKTAFVGRVLAGRRWGRVWDIGCNTGTYSCLAAEHADYVLALDADHLALDRLYAQLKQTSGGAGGNVLPLLADVADPTPGLGWRGMERRILPDRGRPDLMLCLALIHHLVIGRNIPVRDLVAWLAGLGSDLVIEFVGHGDPMVKRLLRNRSGQAIEYSAEALEAALADHFGVVTHEVLESGTRTMYHAQARPNGR
jgi:ribosomal protein L11 methylase PrmA